MFRRAIHHSLIVLAGAVFFVALCATVGIPPSEPDTVAAVTTPDSDGCRSSAYDASTRRENNAVPLGLRWEYSLEPSELPIPQ